VVVSRAVVVASMDAAVGVGRWVVVSRAAAEWVCVGRSVVVWRALAIRSVGVGRSVVVSWVIAAGSVSVASGCWPLGGRLARVAIRSVGVGR
jgi:hypothetical protein